MAVRMMVTDTSLVLLMVVMMVVVVVVVVSIKDKTMKLSYFHSLQSRLSEGIYKRSKLLYFLIFYLFFSLTFKW